MNDEMQGTRAAMAAHHDRPAVTHGMADVEPGVRIHYVVAGDGPRAIVLLHGFPETWREWRAVIPALVQAGFRVVAPDYRGAGDSFRRAGGGGWPRRRPVDRRRVRAPVPRRRQSPGRHGGAAGRYDGVRPLASAV